MPDAPAPTYRVQHIGETDRYVCILPYMGMPDDICGHWSPTLELLTQHMQQQHAGVMIEETATAGEDEDIPEPPMPATTAAPSTSPSPEEEEGHVG